MAGKLKYDPILGRLRLRDVPKKAGHTGKYLHNGDGSDTTLPEWLEVGVPGGATYVRAYWFALVAAGTSGTLSPPAGGVLVLDAWPEGVDALTTELDAGGKPAWQTPADTFGLPLTVALAENGDWALSGIPAEYPVGIVFCYRIQVADLNDAYTLQETQLEAQGTLAEYALAASGSPFGDLYVINYAPDRQVQTLPTLSAMSLFELGTGWPSVHPSRSPEVWLVMTLAPGFILSWPLDWKWLNAPPAAVGTYYLLLRQVMGVLTVRVWADDAALPLRVGTTAGTLAAGSDSRIVAGGTAIQPQRAFRQTAIDLALTATDELVQVTEGGRTITLPTPVGVAGKPYTVDNAAISDISVVTAAGTIEGEAVQAIPPASAMSVYSDGSAWRFR